MHGASLVELAKELLGLDPLEHIHRTAASDCALRRDMVSGENTLVPRASALGLATSSAD